MSEKQSKKQKITYIDDGRTIADMSGLPPRPSWTKQGTSSSFRDIWRTYWQATKMMIKPTIIAVGFLIVVFLIVSIIFWLM